MPVDDQQRPAEPLMHFEVVDAGVGISPRRLGSLFEPFSRGEEGAANSGGLGLAISRRLARLLGGDLTVESTIGKGSTFRVVIPAGSAVGTQLLDGPTTAERDEQDGLQRSLRETTSGRRLLLIESESQHQQVAALLCRSLGIDLTMSSDGQTGLEHALVATDAGRPFDLVLFSSHLAVLDGFEAARTLRQQGYEGVLVALVDRDTEIHRRRSRDAGCDDYLVGPLDGPKLLDLVHKHLARTPACQGAAEFG
jgi:CheY-like chemotaxis protein